MVKLHGTPLLRPRRWDWATPFRLRFCSVVLLRAASAPAKLRLLSTSSASTSTSRTSSVSAAGDDVPQLTKTCAWHQCHVYYLPDFHVYLCYVDLCYVDLCLRRQCRCDYCAAATVLLRHLDCDDCDAWTTLVQLRLRACDCASATALLSRMQLLCRHAATAPLRTPTAGLVTAGLRLLGL